MCAIVVATPFKVFELESELILPGCQGLKHLPSSGHNLLANTVPRHQRNPESLHFRPLQ